MKKTYVVDHDVTGASIIVEIDHSFENFDKNIKEMVDFYGSIKNN